MARDDILARFAGLNVWSRGGQRERWCRFSLTGAWRGG